MLVSQHGGLYLGHDGIDTEYMMKTIVFKDISAFFYRKHVWHKVVLYVRLQRQIGQPADCLPEVTYTCISMLSTWDVLAP